MSTETSTADVTADLRVDGTADLTADHAPVSDPRREALLAAAAEIFAEHGYSGARVQQIAQRAEMTTGAMYNRFKSKSDLLNEALDRYAKDLLDDLERADLSASDILAALGSNLLEPSDDRETMLLLEAFVAARREPEIAARLRPRMADDRQRLAKLVDHEKVEGSLDGDLDTAAIVTFCQAVGLGMQLLKAIDSELPGTSEWDDLLSRLIGSLYPTAPE